MIFVKKFRLFFLQHYFLRIIFSKKNTDFYFGVGIEEEFSELLNIKENHLVKYYPPCLCLYTCIPSRSSQFLTYYVLEPVSDYMRKNNLQLAGDIISLIVSMCKPNDEYFNWHHIWIPIQ